MGRSPSLRLYSVTMTEPHQSNRPRRVVRVRLCLVVLVWAVALSACTSTGQSPTNSGTSSTGTAPRLSSLFSFNSPSVSEWRVGDVTGDGKADLVMRTTTAQPTILVARSNGAGFASVQEWSKNPCPQAGGCPLFELGDVNGDGKADLIAFAWGEKEAPGWANVWVSLSNGNGFDAPSLWNNGFCIREQTCRVADVNGDGKADLVAFTPITGLVYVSLSDGLRFGPNAIWQNFFCILGERCLVADVNGDKKADLIAFKPNAKTPVQKGNVLVAQSDGARFGPAKVWHGYFCVGNNEQCLTGDMNGDGKSDIALLKQWGPGQQILVSLSNGGQFINAVPFSWNDDISGPTDDGLLADVTGDKNADLIMHHFMNGGGAQFTVYSMSTRAGCPAGQVRDPTSGQCKSVPPAQGYSDIEFYNCNANQDANGMHRPVTVYLQDLSNPPWTLPGPETIQAQYNVSGICPYDDNGVLAGSTKIDLTPGGFNSTHTIEVSVVDPGLIGCNERNDPTIASCVREGFTVLANKDGGTLQHTVQ